MNAPELADVPKEEREEYFGERIAELLTERIVSSACNSIYYYYH
jgi:hypothetical protein